MIAASSAAGSSSSYRVKFAREEFLELARLAKPKIIYRRKNVYFFAFDGFVMYCDQCEVTDFSQRILDAIEFSELRLAKVSYAKRVSCFCPHSGQNRAVS